MRHLGFFGTMLMNARKEYDKWDSFNQELLKKISQQKNIQMNIPIGVSSLVEEMNLQLVRKSMIYIRISTKKIIGLIQLLSELS